MTVCHPFSGRRLLDRIEEMFGISEIYGDGWRESPYYLANLLGNRAQSSMEDPLREVFESAGDTYAGMPLKEYLKVCERLGYEGVSGWKTLTGSQLLRGRRSDGSVVLVSEIGGRVVSAGLSFAYRSQRVGGEARWLNYDFTWGLRLGSAMAAAEYPHRVKYWWTMTEQGVDDPFAPYIWPLMYGEREHYLKLWNDGGADESVPWLSFATERLATVTGYWADRLDIGHARTATQALALQAADDCVNGPGGSTP